MPFSVFSFFQIFEKNIPKMSDNVESEDTVAAFLLITGVSNLLKGCFNNLKSYHDWKHFFLFLLRAVHQTNVTKLNFSETQASSLLPSPGDIVGVCRLLFHSLVSVRLCIADGQHRVQAMISVLTAQLLYRSSTSNPPRYFRRNTGEDPDLYGDDEINRVECLDEYCEMFSPQ